MHSRTVDSLLTIVGLVGITALGVFLGRNLTGERRIWRGAGAQAPRRESIAELVDKFARTLPENEAAIMRRRNRPHLDDW